eukprot:TRINITY_DN43283_c0_g1_i1.p1 TRINITY_DN43283_c0_g1~~TRINITY_DN43283_c0_g1_i1.p1  ORF type:complete len:341 (+),score=51.26 TRINITY_DN43283_c0_g1_i1:116-1024(+)
MVGHTSCESTKPKEKHGGPTPWRKSETVPCPGNGGVPQSPFFVEGESFLGPVGMAESESSTPKHCQIDAPTLTASAIGDAALTHRVETFISKLVTKQMVEAIVERRLAELGFREQIEASVAFAVSRVSVAHNAAKDMVEHVVGKSQRQARGDLVGNGPAHGRLDEEALQEIRATLNSHQQSLMVLRPLRERVTKMDLALHEMAESVHRFEVEFREKMSNTRGHVKTLKVAFSNSTTATDCVNERLDKSEKDLEELRHCLQSRTSLSQHADRKPIAPSSSPVVEVGSGQNEKARQPVHLPCVT